MVKQTNCIVYCLQSVTNPEKTYIGKTNDFKRRIRQHNGLCSGGARFTRNHRPWKAKFHVTGLTLSESLKLEWAIKHRRVSGIKGVKGRIATLKRLLHPKKRWTRSSELVEKIAHRIKIKYF